MIALSAVQSSLQTFIRNASLFIDTSDSIWYNQVHWLIGALYLLIIAGDAVVYFTGIMWNICVE